MELRQVLIENQVASPAQIDEALARQGLFGADVITNLLELTALDESATQSALARFYKLQPAQAGELPQGSAAAIELVPREIATSLDVYPFQLESGVLCVISAQPLTDAARTELGLSLKVELTCLLALAPRVKQAIARDYSFALDKRARKAVSRLEGRADGLPSQGPNPMTWAPRFSELPRPHSLMPVPFPVAWAESLTPTDGQLLAETAEQPEVVLRPQPPAQQSGADPKARVRDDEERPSERPSPGGRRRGPYTAAQAKRDLQVTTKPQQVLSVYFDYAAQYFDHSAVFTINGDTAHVRLARGLANARDRARILLSTSPALSRISRSHQWATTRLGAEDPKLAGLLGTAGLKQGILLPIRVKGRCTMILYGGFVNSDVNLTDVGELLSFEALVAQALEHSILVRKAPHPNAAPGLPAAPPAARYARPSIEDQAYAVAGLLGASSAQHQRRSEPSATPPTDVRAAPVCPTVIRERTPAFSPQTSNDLPLSGTGKTLTSLTKQSDPGRKTEGATGRSAKSPPLANQPPGVYDEEFDEARDSGWDFEV